MLYRCIFASIILINGYSEIPAEGVGSVPTLSLRVFRWVWVEQAIWTRGSKSVLCPTNHMLPITYLQTQYVVILQI